MIFRNLTGSGDWTFGQGRQNYLKNNDAIMRNIKSRLLSFKNDCFFALQDGVDWFTILGQKDQDLFLNEIRRVIIGSYGVVKINTVDALLDTSGRVMTVHYNINTFFTTNQTNTVEVPV
jgi:hypothetical protein